MLRQALKAGCRQGWSRARRSARTWGCVIYLRLPKASTRVPSGEGGAPRHNAFEHSENAATERGHKRLRIVRLKAAPCRPM